MLNAERKPHKQAGKEPGATARLQLAAIGLEAEFSLVVDGREVRPEGVFGTPLSFMRENPMHRVGSSYHLRTGGALYFDTGVIEVATPVIEIGPGCAARAGRSLWEGILELRDDLDRWERRTGRAVRLVGFSAHYNISFELPAHRQGRSRTVDKLALLLAHILPFPVMLLAANRRSTGIGVRPRGDRIEITADFTPSPSLMIATATLITGVARAVMEWPSFELEMLDLLGLPRLEGFRPMPHTSRKGWLARYDCFPENPFQANPDRLLWPTRQGVAMTQREVARQVLQHFWHPVRRLSDPFSFRLIHSVLTGHAPSLLDLPDRPPEYDDVGRLCTWENLFPEHELSRSLYEQVLTHAVTGRVLRMHGRRYKPVGMRGWGEVVFRREDRGSTHTFPIDFLVGRLEEWG